MEIWFIYSYILRDLSRSFWSEMKNKFIKVNFEAEYRKVQPIFQQEKLYYRIFLLGKEKNQNFVLRGLPKTHKLNKSKTISFGKI